MWRYAYNLKEIYETPTMPQHAGGAALQRGMAETIIRDVRQTGRTILTEHESKLLLKAYDIPTVETRIAATEQEALQAAEEIGFPIVLKLYSLTITHKTDVGGVQLNLPDAAAVKRRSTPSSGRSRRKPAPNTSTVSPCNPW
jgi:acetyltransferase